MLEDCDGSEKQGMHFYTGGSIIMDAILSRRNYLNLFKLSYEFVYYKHAAFCFTRY